MAIPNDPFILFSYVNTCLRDKGITLEESCAENSLDPQEIIKKLADAGFSYDAEQRKFR